MDIRRVQFAVRDRREELGLTQAEVAEAAGVGRQWVVGLESGRMANPKWASLSAVLEVLGLELEVKAAEPVPSEPHPILTAVIENTTRASGPSGISGRLQDRR